MAEFFKNDTVDKATDLGTLAFSTDLPENVIAKTNIIETDSVYASAFAGIQNSDDPIDFYSLNTHNLESLRIDFNASTVGDYANSLIILPIQGVSLVEGDIASVWAGGVLESHPFTDNLLETMKLTEVQFGGSGSFAFNGNGVTKNDFPNSSATWHLTGETVIFSVQGFEVNGNLEQVTMDTFSAVNFKLNLFPAFGKASGPDTPNEVPTENVIGSLVGDNIFTGSSAIDTVKYLGEAKDFTVKIVKGAATSVQDRKGTEGTDSLTNIEKLDFTGAKDVDLSILNGVANVSSADLSFFIEMYIAYFNRAPDAEGLFYWGTRLSEGMSLQDIAKTFFVLDEAVAVYGGKSNSDLVDTVYQNFLGREAEIAGKEFWTGELDSNKVEKGEFLLAIINGAKAPTSLPSDANYIKNKADIGAYFSVIKGMGNADNAKAAMALYDGTDTSKTAAKNAVDGYYNTASATDGGELLIQLVGVMNDPFAIA